MESHRLNRSRNEVAHGDDVVFGSAYLVDYIEEK